MVITDNRWGENCSDHSSYFKIVASIVYDEGHLHVDFFKNNTAPGMRIFEKAVNDLTNYNFIYIDSNGIYETTERGDLLREYLTSFLSENGFEELKMYYNIDDFYGSQEFDLTEWKKNRRKYYQNQRHNHCAGVDSNASGGRQPPTKPHALG